MSRSENFHGRIGELSMQRRLIRSAGQCAGLTLLLVLVLGLRTLRSGAARADSTPTVTSLTPTSGPVGTTVTITGTNFVVGATSVSFANNPATVTCASTTSCTAVVPAGTGTVSVALGAAGGFVDAGAFTYTTTAATASLLPTVTSLAPTSGPVGTTVTITGTNFVAGATSVSFANNPATVSCASSTVCTAVVPAGTGTVGVGVATAGGAAQAGTFTYTTAAATPIVTGPAVTYQPGWNLVGGPSGTLFSNAGDPLYTFPAGASVYTSLTNTTPIQGGAGYWAFFNAATTLNLNGAAGPGPASVPLPVNQYVMIGNPTTHAVTMSGADVIYTYNPANPSNPYTAVTMLRPGQGGWALSANGGTLTFSPVP
jgi:hypothetical protein